MTTPSGRISNEPEERKKKKEKKMPFIVATFVSACSPRAAHTLGSDQQHFFQLLMVKFKLSCQNRESSTKAKAMTSFCVSKSTLNYVNSTLEYFLLFPN